MERSDSGIIYGTIRWFPRGTEENPRKTSVQIAGLWEEIRAQELRNTKQKY